MDITPEEEANPVLLAFKKITIQLEQLEKREIRAEERERKALEREKALIEQHNKVSVMMLKIVEKADNFQKNIGDVEIRTKNYLSDYFKDLPKSVTTVQRKEWGFDPDAKALFLVIIVAMLIAAWGGYYFTNQTYGEILSYQKKLIGAYEKDNEYLKSKIPAAPAKTKKRKKS